MLTSLTETTLCMLGLLSSFSHMPSLCGLRFIASKVYVMLCYVMLCKSKSFDFDLKLKTNKVGGYGCILSLFEWISFN